MQPDASMFSCSGFRMLRSVVTAISEELEDGGGNSHEAGSRLAHPSQTISSESPGRSSSVPHAGQNSSEPIRIAFVLDMLLLSEYAFGVVKYYRRRRGMKQIKQ